MATINLSRVTKIYPGNVEAIKGIDLSIADGELVVLVGPSGCGKSTLLRMIAGLETITGGEISIGERVVNTLEPADRDIAMVFQNYALYPHMTVRGNLEYGLKNRNTPKPEIEARVNEAARILEIEQFLDRKPRQLSGGQRQRVAMGRAIVRKPKAFLFDEPLSNLDAKLRGQMRVEIRRLQKTLGTTSVYVTHDQLEAMTLADKLVVMNGGVIEQVGKPLDIYTDPASVFVAGFMGSPGMNLVPVETLKTLAGTLPNTIAAATGTIGIRPEDMLLAAPSAPHIAFDVILDAIELVGSESLVYVHAEGIAKDMVVRAQGIHQGETGDRLKIHVPHAHLHGFDAQSGRKIYDIVSNARIAP